MAPSLRFRLFGSGAMPPELEAAKAAGTPLLVREGVSIKAHGSLRTPSRRSSGFTALHSGTLLVMPGRLLASMRRHLLADEWPPGVGTDRSVDYRIDGQGLELVIAVDRVVPGGTGEVTVQYRCPIPYAVLDALPVHEWRGTFASADPDKTLRRI